MDRLLVYDVTCNASVAAATPTEVATVPLSLYYVSRVTIVIPDGHAGLTGIALAFGHQPVIPYNAGAYISGNDEIIPYDLSDAFPAGVSWSVFVCNLDTGPHTWETRWELTLSTSLAVAVAPQLTAGDILQAAQSSSGG